MYLPTEITQSNGRVAEARLVCDRCGSLIGILLMRKDQAEAKRKTEGICQRCKEETRPKERHP